MTLIFDKVAPPSEYMLKKKYFKSLFSPFQREKTVSEELKKVVFFLFCILVDRPMGGGAIAPPPPATLLIGRLTISKIIHETCKAIYDALVAKYVNTPSSQEHWLAISQQFEDQWNLPHIVGAFDS